MSYTPTKEYHRVQMQPFCSRVATSSGRSPARISRRIHRGISYYDEALFLEAMRAGRVKAPKLKLPMPWPIYKNMIDDDLRAIFTYLRTLKPVHHLVDNTEPPTLCKLCGQKHGLGDRN
jgi:hypothetical protein